MKLGKKKSSHVLNLWICLYIVFYERNPLVLRVESINKSNINYPPKIYKHKVFENFGSNIAKKSFTSDGFDILANYNFSSMQEPGRVRRRLSQTRRNN